MALAKLAALVEAGYNSAEAQTSVGWPFPWTYHA